MVSTKRKSIESRKKILDPYNNRLFEVEGHFIQNKPSEGQMISCWICKKSPATELMHVPEDTKGTLGLKCDPSIDFIGALNRHSIFISVQHCCHFSCISCIRNFLLRALKESITSLPACGYQGCFHTFSYDDMRKLLNQDDLDQYNQKIFMEYIRSNSYQYGSCPKCHMIIGKNIPAEGTSNLEPSNSTRSQTKRPTQVSHTKIQCPYCQEFTTENSLQPINTSTFLHREYGSLISKYCRFCCKSFQSKSSNQVQTVEQQKKDKGNDDIYQTVCSNTGCMEHFQNSCNTQLKCNHLCGGVKADVKFNIHLPCLQYGCWKDVGEKPISKANEACSICLVSSLGSQPSIQLSCSHIFHFGCIKRIAQKTISTSYHLEITCPLCRSKTSHYAFKS